MGTSELGPGVTISERQSGSVVGVATSVAAFVGFSSEGPADEAQPVWSWNQYEALFGGIDGSEMGYAVASFYANGGGEAWIVRAAGSFADDGLALIGDGPAKTGLHALDQADPFNLLCLPDLRRLGPSQHLAVASAATAYCRGRRAFAILDLPAGTTKLADAQAWVTTGAPALGHDNSSFAAAYWPEPLVPDPLDGNAPRQIAASGIMAGIYAATDRERGVWTAPAGTSAPMAGVLDLAARLTDAENGLINPLGLNALRLFPGRGAVPWGARTLQGANALASDWKYVPVRRTALYVEESLARGLAWTVFEPDGERLRVAIRQQASGFLDGLWRQGGLFGAAPAQAYFVNCDPAATSAADVEAGIVDVAVGLALARPAEFIVLRLRLQTERPGG